jgi:hypothetical protein
MASFETQNADGGRIDGEVLSLGYWQANPTGRQYATELAVREKNDFA